jgi:hypothetical protein
MTLRFFAMAGVLLSIVQYRLPHHRVIPGRGAAASPEPRTDAVEMLALFGNHLRFWVPGSSLREAPE